jgi:Flp pilus assembly pilin Flp
MEIRQHYQLVRAAVIRADGQTMAEYGVVLAVIVLGAFAAMTALALAFSGRLGNVSNVLGSSL